MTPAGHAAIREQKRAGATLQAIADDYGVSRQHIHELTRDLPVPQRGLLDQALRDRIIVEYQAGHGLEQTGQMLGGSWRTVRRIVNEAGILRSRAEVNRLRRDEPKARNITEFYRQGHSIKTTAKRFGVAVNTAVKYLHAAGAMRSISESHQLHYAAAHQEKRFQAVELYLQGFSLEQTATRLEVSRGFVHRHLRQAGLDTSLKATMARRRARKEKAAALKPPLENQTPG